MQEVGVCFNNLFIFSANSYKTFVEWMDLLHVAMYIEHSKKYPFPQTMFALSIKVWYELI